MSENAATTAADIEALRRDVDYLKDRTEILDCIARHARGCDRHDVAVLTSTYHEDGIDEHGTTVNAGPDYAAWANAVHGATSDCNLHNITTHLCEIDGDEAHAESYVMVLLLAPDNASASVMCGRYVDRLERRDGTWRIALRRATAEIAFTADARILQSELFTAAGYERGTRSTDDPSYERPLGASTDAASRW